MSNNHDQQTNDRDGGRHQGQSRREVLEGMISAGARSTALPQPAAGTAPSPGPMKDSKANVAIVASPLGA